MTRPTADGQLTLHYDPAIGVPVRALTPEAAAAGEAMLWSLYDQIQAQTLLIRGQDSDLLTPETATQMTQRGPRATAGHLAWMWPRAHLDGGRSDRGVDAFFVG